MELFTKYQIPSDLLSFGGPREADTATKVQEVKRYVKAMQEMIKESQERELQEKKDENLFRTGVAAEISNNVVSLSNGYGAPVPQSFAFGMGGMAGEMGGRMGGGGFSGGFGGGGGGGGYRGAPGALGGFSFGAAGAPNPFVAGAPNPFVAGAAKPYSAFAPVPTAIATTTTTTTTTTTSIQPPKPAPVTVTINVKPDQPRTGSTVSHAAEIDQDVEDYTLIPKLVEAKMAELDEDNKLRPTIINTGSTWSKKFQKDLLSESKEETLYTKQQGDEKDKAFDLLDALSRSGCLAVDHASLHVVIASTHCFDKTLMATLIQDNQNPIEKMERSTLIVASAVHKQTPLELTHDEQLARVQAASPSLFKSDLAALPCKSHVVTLADLS
jgi:hypothetical protein